MRFDPARPAPYGASYDRMMAAARQALRRGRAQDLELSPAALEPAAETDIDPAAIRTHILLTLHRELIRRR